MPISIPLWHQYSRIAGWYQTQPSVFSQQIAETVGGPGEWHIIPDLTLRKTGKPVSMATLMKLCKSQCGEPVDAELLGILGNWLDEHFPRADQLASTGGPAEGFGSRQPHPRG